MPRSDRSFSRCRHLVVAPGGVTVAVGRPGANDLWAGSADRSSRPTIVPDAEWPGLDKEDRTERGE
jgi:hypothetical protein